MLLRADGGETPRGRGWMRVGAATGVGWWLRRDFRPVALPESEVAVGEHDQGDVAMETGPESTFVVVQAEFSLRILIEALDNPAHMRKID